MKSTFKAFLDRIAYLNRLPDSGFECWCFHPGMLFNSSRKWWHDKGFRPTPHEGVDIIYYLDRLGAVRSLEAGDKVPAFDDGIILHICRDLLGTSIVIEHCSDKRSRMVSVLAHTTPAPGLGCRVPVKKGQPVAIIADTGGKRLAPHLHITFAELACDIPADTMDWTLFTDREKVNLIHPVFM